MCRCRFSLHLAAFKPCTQDLPPLALALRPDAPPNKGAEGLALRELWEEENSVLLKPQGELGLNKTESCKENTVLSSNPQGLGFN